MAGNPFQDLLQELKGKVEESDVKALEGLSEKGRQAIAEGVMRQSEFSSKLDRLQRLEKAREEWEPWQHDPAGRPEWERRYREYPELVSARDKLQADLAAAQAELEAAKRASLAAGEDGRVDVEKLSEATAALLENKLKGRFIEPASLEKLRKEILEQAQAVTSNMLPLALTGERLVAKFQREFGEELDSERLMEKAQQLANERGYRGVAALEEAYNFFAAPKISERERAARKKEAEEAYARGKMEGELAAATRANILPGMESGTTNLPGMKEAPESADKLPEDYRLGSGALGVIAGRELQKLAAQRENETH
jgi:hypothetical protein